MSTTPHDRVARAWDAFNAAQRTDVPLRFTDILRASYPDAHVVRVTPDNCDLQGFAEAGFAKWSPKAVIDAVKQFSAPGPRLDQDAGHIMDKVKFGRVKYGWQDKKLIVYEVEYQDSPFSRPKNYLFLLGHDSALMDELLLACGRWTKELHEEIYVFDHATWLKSKSLYQSVQSATWDDVVLDERTKAQLMDDVEGFFDNRALYQSFGVPWKRGIILHGVPGNGKTISLKALIHALARRQPAAVPSLYVKSLDSCETGGPKHSIRAIFAHARSMAPCVLVFEDLDSMVTPKCRSYFLNEVDGLEANDGILLVGSTNHLDRLDPAIARRPSRFDRKYHFQLPTEHERTLYCQYWRRKTVHNPRMAFPEDLCPVLARLTRDFSFAYLKELFVASLLVLARGTWNNDGEGEDLVREEGSGHSSATDVVVVDSPVDKTEEEEEEEDPVFTNEKIPQADLLDSTGQSEKPKKKTEKKTKPKKSVPAVEVPNHLKDNQLLAVMKAQAQVLLDEMDNTEDAPASAPKVRPGNASDDQDSDSDDSD